MYCHICGRGFKRGQNDVSGVDPAAHVLCNDLSTWFPGVEQARDTVICKDVRLQFPVNMVSGHRPHAPRCGTCLLDNYTILVMNYRPTKSLGIQSILCGDIVDV